MNLTDSERLARIEVLLEQLVGNGQPGRCAIHSKRIARVESWRNYMAGAIAVILGILTIFGAPMLLAKLH